ncbi:NTP pyrophosphohydrolase [Rhodococcus sp. 06-412-2C]|uniref:NUDIX hydrolase n=1 Tax=unclassified Rhodococcus (in: high G+C Gram-positive bacteria) TaxID=192944 RepID=UPI000B9C75D0|nr:MULTISPECIES: NUDIX hydrolase [unclassified Rhodococcus (in: high G+C Gram-positive bacteria)]OZC90681.1 NTP pyrophosphohydrolase [Rhodococcus sp. 06-412-2C]OZC98063.1 NTP pyrophosphohydrolase [Rhodococcus sp. 06-412-2B]
MRGDGDGWVIGADGSRHWGKHGAAGLLLRAPSNTGEPLVLLQHRALWSHQGGTWALPGGARDSHESTEHAAVREAHEEAGIAAEQLCVRSERVTASVASGWSYTTVVADTDHPLTTVPNGESTELRWVPESIVADLPLHPGFASSWSALRTVPLRVLLDTANVLGSRPNGWWKDRAGSTGALLTSLAETLPRTVELPGGQYGWLTRIEAVLEGEARGAVVNDPRTRTILANGSGDDTLADQARLDGDLTALVTADRGLRDRLPDSVQVLTPSTVLGWL